MLDVLRKHLEIEFFLQLLLLEAEADQSNVPADLWGREPHPAMMFLRGEDLLDSLRVFLGVELLEFDLPRSLEQGFRAVGEQGHNVRILDLGGDRFRDRGSTLSVHSPSFQFRLEFTESLM